VDSYKREAYTQTVVMTTTTLIHLPFSRTTQVCQYQNVSILDFIRAKDDVSGGDSWSYKMCKAPVKSSPPTNQHPTFLQAGCPFGRPANNVRALETKSITFHGLAYPNFTWGLPTDFDYL